MRKNTKNKYIILILLIIVLLSILISINLGYSHISYKQMLESIIKPNGENISTILLQIRLPRIILAILCGMGLSISGCTLQAVTENPLADPGILGINAGAGLAIIVFMSFFPSLHLNSLFFQPLFAILGGILVFVFLYLFAKRNGKLRPAYLLIGGIVISASLSSLMIIIGTNMESSSYQIVSRWLTGNIWGTSWNQVKILFLYLLIFLPLLISKANILDILVLGEEISYGLGVDVESERKKLIFLSVAIAASCISVCGGISFLGLVAPHISRKFVGVKHKYLLIASLLTGGLLLLLADTLGRSVFKSIEIPVGIVISILAAPYFMYLLYKQI